MKLFISELAHFSGVAIVSIFLVAFYIRWKQSYRISHGHFIIGLGAVGLTFLALLVAMFAYEFVVGFLLLCLLGSGIWLVYNNWYHFHFPYPVKAMNDQKPIPRLGLNSRLGRMLRKRESERPELFNTRFWLLGLGCLFLLGLSFGFYRVVTIISDGEKRAVAEKKAAVQDIKREVGRVEAKFTKKLDRVKDTLKLGQAKIAETTNRVNQTTAKLAATVAAQQKQSSSRIEKKLDRNNANVDRSRRANAPQFAPILPRSNLQFLSPDMIKPLPADPQPRKGRRRNSTSSVSPADDSTFFVRQAELILDQYSSQP